MKIGILTQPLHNNYGGLLQNYALQQALKRIGVEPETIDHNSRKIPATRMCISRMAQHARHLLKPTIYKAPDYCLTDKEFNIISRNSKHFIDTYIAHTLPFDTEVALASIVNERNYNGYVVGSDQCWRPSYSGGFLKELYLSFIEGKADVRRVAYAASFGTDKWEYTLEETSECSRLAKLFDLVTVREKSGLRLCKEYLGVDAIHVLDPTMLLDKEDYETLVEKENDPQSKGNLFHYILDPAEEKKMLINSVAQKLHLEPFSIMPKCQAENRTKSDVKNRIEDCVFPSVTSWLRGFMDAEMVIVDSFHGAVFSIIFNKPFWVMANAERGNARFESLLGMFGLEDRMVSPENSETNDWTKPIDWKRVNAIREKERNGCIDILKQALNG